MARPLRVEFEDAICHLCLDYAAVAQRIRRTQVNLQSNRCAAADHHNVKCLDVTPIFP